MVERLLLLVLALVVLGSFIAALPIVLARIGMKFFTQKSGRR